jgi:putative ABC transport system permease protein
MKTFFNLSIRVLLRNKWITAINILSLSIGICATLIIFQIVRYEYSFEKHVPFPEQVYRVINGGINKSAAVQTPLIQAMKEELTGVQHVVPVLHVHQMIVNPALANPPEDIHQDKQMIFTNAHFFDLFPHEWLIGQPSLLLEPNRIVLKESTFRAYFPDLPISEALGATLQQSDTIQLMVAGVIKDLKGNSDFDFKAYVSFVTIAHYHSLQSAVNWESWNSFNSGFQCFLRLEEGQTSATLEQQLANIVDRHTKLEHENNKTTYRLQPIHDVHFDAAYNWKAVSISTLRNLLFLGLFLLLLGAINFINLSTAQSMERAKEIGIRKTLGSSKTEIIKQFLMETALLSGIATLLSFVLLPVLLVAFKGYLPENFSLQDIPIAQTALFLLIQWILVTVLSSLYPIWIFLGYAPILALKNQASKNSNLTRSAWIRRSLTVFQFTIAQVLLIVVLFVSKQILFATTMDMGFQKEAILNFYLPDFNNSGKGQVLADQLAALPELAGVSFGNQTPAMDGAMSQGFTVETSSGQKEISVDSRDGDDQFIKVYNIPLLAGRNIHLIPGGNEILINEKMLETLELTTPEEAIGMRLNNNAYTIVGVMKNFNIASIHHAIRPMMYIGRNNGYVMHVALQKDQPASWKNAIQKIEETFQSVYPHTPFTYSFLDTSIRDFYIQEQRLAKLLSWAVGLAITIACLGLVGLAIFTTNQRIKEIGIRKVLGASVAQILLLLTKNMLLLVLIASMIAAPIAYYFVHDWLQDFVYKIAIQWWVFVLSGVGMLAVAILVLSTKTLFAAKANPVQSLRDD